MKIDQLHETIKSKLVNRTTTDLMADAMVAATKRKDSAGRMVFALIMDVIATRIPESEFDILFDSLIA